MRKIWIVACLLAAGVVAVVAVVNRREQDKAIAKLRHDLERVNAALASDTPAPVPPPIYVNTMPVPARAPAAAAIHDERPTPPQKTREEAQAESLALQREQRDQLEVNFARGHSDPGLTPRASNEARQKLTAVLPTGSELRSFECHETMCRVESSHANPMEAQAFMKAAFLDPETQIWNSGGFSAPLDDVPGSDGKVETVTFIGRAGQTGVPTE
jgi:hypothetical protein